MVNKNLLSMISSLWLKIKNFFSNTRKRSLFLRSLGLSVLVLAIAAGVFIATKPKIIEKSKAAERVLIPVKSSTPAEFAPGEILIKFKKGTKLNLSSKAVSSDRTGGKVNVSVNDYDVNSLPKLIRSAQSYIKYINKVIPDTQPVNTRIKLLEGITKETQNKEEIAEEIRMLKQVKSQTGSDFSNIYKIVLKSPKELTSAVSKDNKILAYTHKVDGVEVLEAIPSDDKLYTLQKIEELKRDPQVEYAVPNYVMKALLTPNDPLFNHELLWGIRKIDSTQAWDKTTGNDQIVVAVIDTGIDYTHEDIRENVWINWAEVSKPKSQIIDVNGNGVIDCEDLFDPKNKGIQDGKDNDQNGYYDDFCGWNFLDSTNKPLDDHGHGTHVSGTIGAVTNNNRGVAGVNWKVKIMAAKFLNSSGTGYLSGAIEALKYAADTGARVSSNSWGASSPPIPVLNEAIDYEYAKGMVIVAAAGNESHDAFKAQPAAYEKVITVSAIDSQDKIASFSNYGEKIDVGAPGVNVLSLRAKGTDMYGDGKHIVNDKYYFASGTSMATPHVSGLAALILARNPNLTNEQVRQVIRIGSNDMGPSGKDDQYGFGRINSNLAINFLDSNPNVLTPQITSPENNSVFSADTITVKGSLGGKNVKSYKIEIGKNQSWTKVAESNQIPANDVLGVINWKSLGVSPGPYNIRLVVTDTKGNNYESEVYAIEMDTDIVTGWPKDIDPSSHLSILGPGGSPAFGDVDGDGKKELVASDDTKLYVFRKNGTLLPGFPFEYKSPNPTFVWPQWTWKAKLNVVDIDKDGKDEIITYWALDAVTNDYMTYFIVVIRGDGTIQPGWPYAMQDWGMNNYIPAVGDINNDGKNELVFYTCDWYRFGSSSYSGEIYLHVVDVNNKELSGFPKYIDKTVSGGTYTFEGLTGPSLADVNGDGKLEIGFNVLNKVYLLDNNGNNLPNWPIINSDGYGNARSGVTYADLDGDGKLEIISTPDITYTGPYTNSDSQTYAFKVDGSVYPGFPRKDSLRSLMTDYGWPVINSAANTGGSGRDELYYSKHSSKSNPSSPENNYYPPTISDIDGDGQLEYILGSRTWGSDYIQFQDNTEHAITIMKQDGITKYWDRTDGRGFNNQLLVIGTFVIADMDGNGKMEIAGGRRGKLYLYEIPTLPGKTAKYEWPMQGHDPQFSGRLVTSGIVPTPTSKPTPTVIPTVTPTSKPTATPTSKPSPTVVPTVTPTSKPTVTPTSKPAPTKTPTPIPGSLPDLVITEMTRSDGYYHVTYCNQGTGVSKEGNWTAIQLVNKVTDKSLEYDLYVLQPSRCSNLQFDCNDVRIGDTCNKSLTMEVILDPRDRITESNENNNTYTKSF